MAKILSNIKNYFSETPQQTETQGFKLGKKIEYITPEMRAYAANYTDPLVLNFKLLLNFDKPYGLFAPETRIDSALAYLKRIGDEPRYLMLKQWIEQFKSFIRNYDFLIMGIEGLEQIFNAKPHEMFTGEEKITITIRETADMRFQALLTMYHSIWFDGTRVCEVLPVNLRRFDMSVLIYGAGYYNMALYDITEDNGLDSELDPEVNIFPTLRKISSDFFNTSNGKTGEGYNFNHHLVHLADVEINIESSGTNFFANLSNEQATESIKNTLAITFRFAHYVGIFNNIFGEFDFVKLLAVSAAQDKVSNQKVSFLKSMGDGFKKAGRDTLNTLNQKGKAFPQKFMSKSSPIGNALKDIADPGFLPKMVKNTADLGITITENAINSGVATISNMVMQNFSDNFITTYQDFTSKPPDNIKLIETPLATDSVYPPAYIPGTQPNTGKNIRFEKNNIYNRNSF